MSDSHLLNASDRSHKFKAFTEEHQIFVAYCKRYLHQDRVHFRFEATFPSLTEPGTVGAFVGMYVSRWAPIQNPDLKTVGEYSWGPELLDEFEFGAPLDNTPSWVPKGKPAIAPMTFGRNAYMMGGRRL